MGPDYPSVAALVLWTLTLVQFRYSTDFGRYRIITLSRYHRLIMMGHGVAVDLGTMDDAGVLSLTSLLSSS